MRCLIRRFVTTLIFVSSVGAFTLSSLARTKNIKILAQLSYVSNERDTTTDTDTENMSKPRILCLHGKAQTAESFSKKIGGARRKLERAFDLTFLDGPIDLEDVAEQRQGQPTFTSSGSADPIMSTGRAWFLRELADDGDGAAPGEEHEYRYIKLTDAIEYVAQFAEENGRFDALMGFSQGGTLATALATSGAVPVRAVLTAGSPHIEEAFVAASDWARTNRTKCSNDSSRSSTHAEEDVDDIGTTIPKLHLTGETDAMISTESTARLAERGGNGEMIAHEKGHLFPTRAVHVDRMVQFLKSSLEP